MAFSTLKKAARNIHKQKGNLSDKKLLNEAEELITETYNSLNHAVEKGFELDTKPDTKFTNAILQDVWIFSACKSYLQLKELSNLLIDENDSPKPWKTFEKEVLKTHETYNVNYLSTEYNHAVNSSYMAAKWQRYKENSDRYYLKYVIRGHNTRVSHAAMEGIILPQSDPFWLKYLPPNDWNCFCGVKQVLKEFYKASDSTKAQELGEAATTRIGKDGTNKAAMFRTNAGNKKEIFGQKHPFRNNTPKSIEKRILKKAKKTT